MPASLPLSVNHYLCPEGLSCIAFMDQAVAHGYSGIGLTAAALRELPPARLRTELAARGLRVSSVNSAGYFLQPDFEATQAKANLQLLQAAAELQAPLNVIVGGNPALALAQARPEAVDGLGRLAESARGLGVRLVVEPLHPVQARGKSCLNTIAQVEAAFAQVPGLALNADLFHLWWDPDLQRLLRGDSVPIALLQVCDVADAAPAQQLPRRVPLDEGCLDWRACVGAVRRAFPRAEVELELFAEQLPGRALDELLRTNASALAGWSGGRDGDRPHG
ncbi:MAG TPA: sugar phosphate isomerase/epimerase family protein [Ramlibacter sp.]|nr:sugar phosphate isomerase/epimerase family protein [Ramlibacter sp.]